MYVDDLLLSGPISRHQALWEKLRSKVNFEDPEALDRFLGRYHHISSTKPYALDIVRSFDPPEEL